MREEGGREAPESMFGISLILMHSPFLPNKRAVIVSSYVGYYQTIEVMCHTVLVTFLVTVTECQIEALKGGGTYVWLIVGEDPSLQARHGRTRNMKYGAWIHCVIWTGSRELEPEAGQAPTLKVHLY